MRVDGSKIFLWINCVNLFSSSRLRTQLCHQSSSILRFWRKCSRKKKINLVYQQFQNKCFFGILSPYMYMCLFMSIDRCALLTIDIYTKQKILCGISFLCGALWASYLQGKCLTENRKGGRNRSINSFYLSFMTSKVKVWPLPPTPRHAATIISSHLTSVLPVSTNDPTPARF